MIVRHTEYPKCIVYGPEGKTLFGTRVPFYAEVTTKQGGELRKREDVVEVKAQEAPEGVKAPKTEAE